MELHDLLREAPLHPMTQEPTLTYMQVLQALDCLSCSEEFIVLGGDILDSSGMYVFPNWHYSPDPLLSHRENAQKSCHHAQHFIEQLPKSIQYTYILVLQPIK